MKKFFTLLCVALMSVAGFAQDAYDATAHTAYVSGTQNFCTGDWASADAMTYDATSGLWKITMNVATANETMEFKVVYDAGWYGTSDGGNVQFSVTEASDVEITFDPNTFDVAVTGDKVAGAITTISYITAVGDENLFGSSWDLTAEANKLKEVDDDYYQLTLNGVAAGTYDFKFAANGAWAIQWGGQSSPTVLASGVAVPASTNNGGNFRITLEKGATYNVTLTLDLMAETPYVTATIVKAGDAEITEDVYSIAGNMNDWNQNDATTEMTKTADGVYTYTFSALAAGDYQFKVVTNHAWTTCYGGEAAGETDSDNAWFTLAEDGDVTITLDLTGDAPAMTITLPGATTSNTYTVTGKYAAYSNWTGFVDETAIGTDVTVTVDLDTNTITFVDSYPNTNTLTFDSDWNILSYNGVDYSSASEKTDADSEWAYIQVGDYYGGWVYPLYSSYALADATGGDIILSGWFYKSETEYVWGYICIDWTVDSAETGIADAFVTNNTKVDNAIYDLSGRRLSAVPAKGIYVRNNKKYIAK